jgi:hypothetical protein
MEQIAHGVWWQAKAFSVPGGRNSLRLNLAVTKRTSHSLAPTLQFTDPPAHPSPTLSPTFINDSPSASRQVSTHLARPSHLLHNRACYWYGSVAVCVALAALCDAILPLWRRSSRVPPWTKCRLPWSCTRDIPHQTGVSPCSSSSAASDHICYLRPPCRSFVWSAADLVLVCRLLTGPSSYVQASHHFL